MRILFAGKQHFDPGGIPASTDQLARRLAGAGHEVCVFAHAAFDGPARSERERRSVCCEPADGYVAYSVDRLPPAAGLGIVLRRFDAEVIVVNAGGWWWHDWTRALVRGAPRDVRLVLYVRDHEAIDLLDELSDRVDLVIVNADFHARSAERRGVGAVVVPSLVEGDLYRTESSGEAVVFINPVASKGVDTAFALAECRPDIPFQFRQSWNLDRSVADRVAARAAELGNVTCLGSSTDPTAAYRPARLLLVPYVDLNRPRVIAEAQVSGIPILARGDPALREAVGPGGILVPPDAPLARWADGLSRLWDDPACHGRLAEAALQHSRRAEIDPEHLAEHFAGVLSGLVRRRQRAGRSHEPLEGDRPVASVVVPVRNVAETVDDQLRALANQSYEGPWEVVVADNGSTDDTRRCVEAWRARLPALTVVDASAHRGVAHARNIGLRAARGDVLLICDGDDVVAPDWLEHMVRALDEHPIVTGFIDIVTMNDPEQYEWTGDASRQAAPVAYNHLPYAPGGNIGMWRDVFDAVGPFDERLRRAEDIDFGWRAAALGVAVYFQPAAILHRRLKRSAASEFRSAVRGGIAEPGLYRRHRDRGMPRLSRPEVLTQYRWLLRTVPDVVAGRADRHQWAHHAGKRIGRIVGSVRNRALYL